MKKLFVLLLVLLGALFLTACQEEEKGDYTPGMYYASTGGHQNTFGVLFVNEHGFVESIFIDSVYLKRNAEGTFTWIHTDGSQRTGYATTKMSLGDGDGWGYNMFWSSYAATDDTPTMDEYKAWLVANNKLEWVQQVQLIIDQVIEAQGIPMENNSVDVVSGATITVDDYYSVIADLLEQAKK